MAAADDVLIRLSRDEALVLYELLHRSEDRDLGAQVEHHAEKVALWNLSATLERELAEPFDPAYRQLLADARTRLAGNEEPDTGSS